jgi:hypothetical protein
MNYHNPEVIVRNLRELEGKFAVLMEWGPFSIVRIDPPGAGGYVFWVVNESGFLWEPASDEAAALAYLESSEALEYVANLKSTQTERSD